MNNDSSDLIEASPVVIGGTGGSGTRALQSLLEAVGFFMGNQLNESKDAMNFEPFLDQTIDALMQQTHSLDYDLNDVAGVLWKERVVALRQLVAEHQSSGGRSGELWGWKNPRSIYILPLIHAVVPDFRFIHLVRDGRDMALSGNQNQVRKHYQSLFGEEPHEPQALASMRMWAKVNGDAAVWGERYLGARYLRLRYEDVCLRPGQVSGPISELLGVPVPESIISQVVRVPDSLGRWRDSDLIDWTQLPENIASAIENMGYKAA